MHISVVHLIIDNVSAFSLYFCSVFSFYKVIYFFHCFNDVVMFPYFQVRENVAFVVLLYFLLIKRKETF